MKFDLPDGLVARIEYQGDVAPRVTLAPTSTVMPVGLFDLFDSAPLAAFDRIAAEMDRQTDAMLREVHMLQAAPLPGSGGLDLAALGKLPPGTVQYRFVSTSDGSGTCDRSVVTSYGPDQRAKVVSRSSGDCQPMDRTTAPAGLDAPVHPAAPGGLTRTEAMAAADRSHATTV
ncbi:hypothetical protein [Sphingomonas sp. MMS24-J13]|uniref:hypothetical protein n=1 Tax=Sphingomonas sp. MMS24-J13 TaxID=3238686 RepID=UPI00384C10C0